MSAPLVLDVTAGPRMMWFDKDDPRAVFSDERVVSAWACDGRHVRVSPDVRADFRDLPFPDDAFQLVVFDPPHLDNLGATSWTALKYGALFPTWREDLRRGFDECFRVLAPNSVLVFKWNETRIPTSEVIALSPVAPLFGHASGKASKTHWLCFIKPATPDRRAAVNLGGDDDE